MPQEIPVHPAALLFPMMSEKELSDLADDIAANGLMEPVVLYHGQILDGRNRLAACELGGVEPRFVEVDGELPSPAAYVWSKNGPRRHMSKDQLATTAAKMVPLLQEEAKQRQIASLKQNQALTPLATNGDNGRVSQIAGDKVGVHRRDVERALKVQREAPEVFEKVERGDMGLRAAADALPVKPRSNGANKSEPYEPKTDHQKKLAEGQKERMVHALSVITGVCRGLGEMDIRKAVSACDEEERNTWIERAKELSSQLRAFSARLQKGF